ncbi:MAG: winged helix-turn-helix transcriptional regulator [Myxococcaceae bacterium]|nr:winged helix-turn-helix transcriptional regulator [Myxococcaceae bacterium]
MTKTSRFDLENEPLPARIAVGLNKVGLALKFQGWQAAGQRGLSPLQGQILSMLSTARGGLKPTVLAERLAVSAPTISDSVKALTTKGLVERRADERDARVSLVVLTTKGRAEARAAAGWPDFLAGAVEALDEAEQEAFWRGLVKMIATLQRDEQIPVSRMCITCTHFRPNAHRDASMPHHCAFVDAPMGARHLRLECPEHEEAVVAARNATWKRFTSSP